MNKLLSHCPHAKHEQLSATGWFEEVPIFLNAKILLRKVMSLSLFTILNYDYLIKKDFFTQFSRLTGSYSEERQKSTQKNFHQY